MVIGSNEGLEKIGGKIVNEVGKYATKIKWRQMTIDARPFGKGYFGKRIKQTNPKVDAYELKINPK